MYHMVARKRGWVPEWLWSLLKPVVTWLWPVREILTVECQE